MKKILTIVTFGILWASAPSLLAASQVDFSGYLRIRAYALGGYWNGGGNDGSNDLSDRYFNSRLRLNFVFRPTDQLEIKWRVHGPHGARWGDPAASYQLTTRYLYGIVKTDYGKFSIGHISSDLDSAGLQTLGYLPAWGLGSQALIFDVDSEDDGLMYRHDWANNFGVKAFYAVKGKDNDIGRGSDQDYNRYSVEPYYKWDNGGVSLALQYDRNMGRNQKATATAPDIFFAANYHYTLNPAVMHKWNLSDGHSLAFHFEGKFARGERQNGPGSASTEKVDLDGAGLYADLNYSYGPGDVTLGGWWFDGSADGSGRHDLVNPGEGFYPYVVFYSGHPQARGSKSLEGNQRSNHWAASFMGNHRFTPEVQLNYGVAHFSKTRTANNVSKGLGTEIDLGFSIKLLDNLRFSTKAGYFITGDYYREQYNRRDYGHDIMAWGNELIFSF